VHLDQGDGGVKALALLLAVSLLPIPQSEQGMSGCNAPKLPNPCSRVDCNKRDLIGEVRRIA
jgi:hypothetical protein